ncbi:restriction endonuclease subunit S [Pseudoalteromonas luteoviolacea]|uniref:Type I restriction modification DNA specificity domain-containing protein n=1 Tax=Pseudoalteromonas luteoviolacea S4054 TaxID=1129367 RepID=A0A0F6AH18_9GAMM|nr:restriction endonuclease subunit S [Pseudoalteromonas luteoviolacea]AOT07142.1 hypothetical protein S4054249_04370 [Pseudoalteromonas luteoviolacea]AOT12059.1 hypothetical protein S40542_04370 [Pseudoalteromonas luteoviolacea]AOT16972.1 hypothetical protein S4054_04370 [Pseudoalteromonas luteoviolacea]KKE85443.1 hypothetical protein N479_05415 [Pseudoalteromonas luteoviolacea S4054]KZN73791.1 hypothetical protein N481_11825 [Pseudoalteromonas luteoviolacea S4047-1]
MVPSGWKHIRLDKLCETVTSGSRDWAKYYAEQGSKFIRMTNLQRENIYLDLSDLKFVDIQSDSSDGKRTSLKAGDILMSITAELGKIGWVHEGLGESYINQHTALIRLDQSQANSKYIAYLLSSKTMNHKINRLNDSGAKAGLNLPTIRSIPIDVPPIQEQHKIAKILSTWDKAISTTERLIDNSKQQKKALMQQLLTGKKRLLDDSGKQFDGEWEEVKLGDISFITTGSSNREDSSLDGEFTFFDRSEDIRTSSRYLFDSEAVIVPGEGQDFVPKHFKGKFDLHQRTYAIMDFSESVGKYLFYYIGYYRHYFLSQAVGSTVKSLRLPMFQKMPIRLPTIAEQQKIAKVLTIADKEIELLEQQLADLKQEKKALMQQLLTGKRRVKVDSSEAA